MVLWLQSLRAVTSRIVGIALVVLAGCPIGGDDQVDPDASGDGNAGTSGLTVTWAVAPAVPGPVSADVSVRELRLEASSLRVIGDSAPPGDARTSRTSLDLRWRSEQAPAAVELAAAPAGLYSRLEIGVGGSDEHLTIKGDARVGGTVYPFEIEDERQHALTLSMALALAPGQHATIPVTVDVAVILAAVPFDQLSTDNGTLVFDDDDPRLDALWSAIDRAVTVPATFVIGR